MIEGTGPRHKKTPQPGRAEVFTAQQTSSIANDPLRASARAWRCPSTIIIPSGATLHPRARIGAVK